MNDKPNNGGAAFPVSTIDNHTNEGMTLRDYFAAAALTGLLASGELKKLSMGSMQKITFCIADAMLKARQS